MSLRRFAQGCALAVLALLGSPSAFSQSLHTVTFTGSPTDFNAAEKWSAADNVDYYVTYDDNYLYFGAFRTNNSAWGQYDHFTIYLDTDPSNTLTSGGNGSTTGVNWDSKTPTLPFLADYRVALRPSSLGESFLSSWSGGAWTTGGANASGWTQYATQTANGALEVRVPRSALGNPDALYFTLYSSYDGGFFAAAPGSISGTAVSGYFGGIGLSSAGNSPTATTNLPIKGVLTNTTPAAGVTYGKWAVSAGSFTAPSGLSIAPGGAIAITGGTVTVGSSVFMGTTTMAANRGTTIHTSGTGTLSSTTASAISFYSDGYITGNNLTYNGTLNVTRNFTPLPAGGLTFGNGSFLYLRNSAAVKTNAPTYATGSTLVYSTPSAYNVANGTEWTAGTASGAGVPYHVTISFPGTDVQFGNSSSYRQVRGNLTISSGSTLTLSGTSGGNLYLSGNFANSGTFNANGRALHFTGSGTAVA
ncbi:MAG: hypothetical protein EOO11_19595, partial [Chitinophagaceae bacterium]